MLRAHLPPGSEHPQAERFVVSEARQLRRPPGIGGGDQGTAGALDARKVAVSIDRQCSLAPPTPLVVPVNVSVGVQFAGHAFPIFLEPFASRTVSEQCAHDTC